MPPSALGLPHALDVDHVDVVVGGVLHLQRSKAGIPDQPEICVATLPDCLPYERLENIMHGPREYQTVVDIFVEIVVGER
jgi:hypothetical protein